MGICYDEAFFVQPGFREERRVGAAAGGVNVDIDGFGGGVGEGDGGLAVAGGGSGGDFEVVKGGDAHGLEFLLGSFADTGLEAGEEGVGAGEDGGIGFGIDGTDFAFKIINIC